MKKLFLATLLATFAFGGCVKEKVNTLSPMDGETTISIRVPYATVATRAIVTNSVADNRIDEMDVLLFDASDKFVRAFYGTNIVTDVGDPRLKTIKVRLPAGTYRTVLLANAHKEYIASPFTVGDDRQTALATLKRTLTGYGNKYASDGAASNYAGFPMWGDAGNITITSGASNTFPAHLYRALTKVNLTVNYVETVPSTPDFVLKSVDVYNYNLSGYLTPTDINWTANPKIATELKTREGTANPISLNYDNTFIKQNVVGKTFSCTDEIFVYESKADNGAWSWEKNTCIVVGGEYLGQMGYYRLDFTQDGTTRLDLLRNHSYNFTVVAIKTSGYTTPEEALKNLPDNLDYTVELWDDFDMDNIDFNGQYYIQYTSREALFTQLGTPSVDDGRNAGDGNYIITLKTNLPSLTAKDFTDITAGAGDGSWNEAPAGTWNNGHFSAVLAKGSTIGEETTYTITIKALPAITGDPIRNSTFNIVGANLSSALRVTQDKYLFYRLLGSPDPSNVIKLDGSARRYPVTITSTHDYGIIFTTTNPVMLTGVWTAQTGGTLLTDGSGTDGTGGTAPKAIPIANTAIWVDINAYDLNTAMIANMEVKHIDPLSDAPSLNYNFLRAQHLYLTASIGGLYAIEVPKAGGEVNIDINSNVDWKVLEFKVGSINAPTTMLDRTSGSGNNTVKLTLGNNKSGVDQVYTIIFFGDKDANWTLDPGEITTQTLTITHKTSLAIRAVPGIIGITEDDELTLDGWQASKPAYMLYFKWGSLIGLSSDATLTRFNTTTAKDIVCYTPNGFNTALYGDPSTWDHWDKINHINGGETTEGTPFPDDLYLINKVINNANPGLTHGIGDPCSMDVIKGGAKVSGKYKMPENGYWDVADEWWNTPGWSKKYGTWEQNSDNSYAIWETEPGGEQKYPAAGGRKSNGMYLVGFAGDFWSSTYGGDATDGRNMYLAGNPYSNGGVYSPRSWAYMIRCISK